MNELSAGSQIGGYRILSLIGRGGMGVVYLAEHTSLERRVALKVLAPQYTGDASFRARFERESRLAAALDHPNVVPIYEAGEIDGVLFIAMRYVNGPDLRAVLDREGRFDVGRALGISAQLASALDAAHAHGLIHRDVKPGNVLLAAGHGADGGEHVYLTDFGLTKRSASKSGLTQLGQLVGTIDYIAPEQISGEPVDGRTDIYALGCVLFEMLAGRAPFARDSDIATMAAHLHEPPPRITELRPDLPAAADELFVTALAKRPDERFSSGAELVRQARSAVMAGTQPTTGQPTIIMPLPDAEPTVVAPAASGMAAAATIGEPTQLASYPPPPPEPVYQHSPPPPAADYYPRPTQPPPGGYPPAPPGGYYYPPPPPAPPPGSGPPKALLAAGSVVITLLVLGGVAFAIINRPVPTASPPRVGQASFTPQPSGAASTASPRVGPTLTPTGTASPTRTPSPTPTTTSSPTPTPSTTPTPDLEDFSQSFARLRDLTALDDDDVSICEEQINEFSSRPELFCFIDTDPSPIRNYVAVWYSEYADSLDVDSAFEDILATDVPTSAPSCFRDVEEPGAGQPPCRARYVVGDNEGLIGGYNDGEGGNWIVWTIPEANVVGEILDTDSNFRQTFRYWRNFAHSAG